MNHANDALWWRLKHPAVRELAALLTTPPVWTSPDNLSVADLLGADGFRLLLEWDDRPPAELAGLYDGTAAADLACRLALFWLDKAPHTRLLAWDGAYADCLLAGICRTVYIDCGVHSGSDTLPSLRHNAALWARATVFLESAQQAARFHALAWTAATVSRADAAAVASGRAVLWLDETPPAAPVLLSARPFDARPPQPTHAVWLACRPDGVWHETDRFRLHPS